MNIFQVIASLVDELDRQNGRLANDQERIYNLEREQKDLRNMNEQMKNEMIEMKQIIDRLRLSEELKQKKMKEQQQEIANAQKCIEKLSMDLEESDQMIKIQQKEINEQKQGLKELDKIKMNNQNVMDELDQCNQLLYEKDEIIKQMDKNSIEVFQYLFEYREQLKQELMRLEKYDEEYQQNRKIQWKYLKEQMDEQYSVKVSPKSKNMK